MVWGIGIALSMTKLITLCFVLQRVKVVEKSLGNSRPGKSQGILVSGQGELNFEKSQGIILFGTSYEVKNQIKMRKHATQLRYSVLNVVIIHNPVKL